MGILSESLTESMKRYFLFPLLFLLVGLSAVADDHIMTKTLDNGLKIVVLEEHRAPIAMQLLCYKVGSMDELPGKTGLSHALEHLMFKGTPNAPGNTFSVKIQEMGGMENAYTTYDYTAYHQLFPKESLEEMMAFEADRMRHLILSDNDFDQEIKVVRDERLRKEDNPYQMLYEQLMATAYQTHPYRNPVIGWMPDLLKMTKNDAQEWYQQWYAPNHAVLIISGDVKADEVFRLAEKYYGQYSADPVAKNVLNRENQPAKGVRYIQYKHPQAELPTIMMAFPTPALRSVDTDKDPYALAVLSAILSDTSSSRFPKSLVRERKMAQSAWSAYDFISRGPTLFLMGGTAAEGYTIEQLEKAIFDEVKAIAEQGVTVQEVERVKTALVVSRQYQRDSLSSRTNDIAALTMANLPSNSLDTIIEKLQAVTTEDVRSVAQRYFDRDYATIAVLLPDAAEK